MLFVTNLTWNSFISQNSKLHALFRQFFLRYVLMYNLEVSFLIFQLSHNLSTIKWVIKNCFFPYSRYFPRTSWSVTRTPDNSNFFRFPVKVRVIESRLYVICERSVSFLRGFPHCPGISGFVPAQNGVTFTSWVPDMQIFQSPQSLEIWSPPPPTFP